MYYPESLKKVSDQAVTLYLAKSDNRLFFHNLAHTARLLDAIDKINSHYQLDDKNYFIICASAWLYDLEMKASEFGEIRDSDFTGEILKGLGIASEETEEIKKCISAAMLPRDPLTQNEKIFCDAISFYLGSSHFIEYNKLRRKEIEAFANEKFKGNIWRSRTIDFLEKHQFHTEYCQTQLNKIKEGNLRALILMQEEKNRQKNQKGKNKNQTQTPYKYLDSRPDNILLEALNRPPDWKHKSKHHLSGVETVFRNSSSNHLSLSVMADNKAFIMISVNSILISLGIGLIIGKFVLVPKLFIPTVLLLFVNVFTIIYSVLATRPGLMRGKFTMADLNNKKVDLLFFGNFFKMPLVDFEFGMKKMMDDSDFLYDNLIRDIYAQGQILGRKFRLLRFSYNIFMYGTASTVIAYIISFFL